MINESLGLFLRFDLPEYFRKTFYPEIFKYFDYVLPILKGGKHTRDNEMECVGSQYLHLSYLEQDDSVYVIFRNEQHADYVFKIENNSLYKSIEVFSSYSEDPLSHRIKKNKNGFSLKFKDLDDLKYFLISNPQITNKTEEIIKPQNIGKNSKKDRKPLPKPIFKIQMKKSDGHVHVFYEIGKDTFREELKVFDLMNVMVCGVSSNVNKKIPKIFFKSDVSQFVQKLIKQMK